MNFIPFKQRMQAEGLPEIVIQTFQFYYDQLAAGHTGYIPESDIRPIETLPEADTFGDELAQLGRRELPRTVMIKLNGGLGTSMGLNKAKSLLPVKQGLTFLDIIARQAIHARLPLLLMNSFATRDDSLAALRSYPELWENHLGLDFVQHKFPKVRQSDLAPAEWPPNPRLEWNPPGHGDIYTALLTSGTLDRLLQAGYRHAFISNGDNLGAVIDPAILGYFAQNDLPFLMEVTERTESDRKGGHLARRLDGQLILRELAQCPPEDRHVFENVSRHKFFNTNNLWVSLPVLAELLERKNGILGLPLIRNAKTVDPRDPDSTPVYQLETAMGSAIAVFEGAQAVRVPRTRFAPVKTTDQLLAVRSDAYLLTEDYRVIPHPSRPKPPVIRLDSRFYRLIDGLEARFPRGAPSLLGCERLEIEGDVGFGAGVRLEGEVLLRNQSGKQVWVEDAARLRGKYEWS